ncbi:MAG TPA: hypothetical protein VIV40_17725 [Kofleriaceae bacterium]
MRTLLLALLETYLEYRLMSAEEPLARELQMLGEQLDHAPEDDRLRNRLKELELTRLMRKNDVRVLDPCRFQSR